MTRCNSCPDFQYISENVLCLLQGSCICLHNLVNNERKFLFISCCEPLGEVRFELAAGQGGGGGQTDGKRNDQTDGKRNDQTDGKRNDQTDGERDSQTDGQKNDGADNVGGRYSPHPVRKISCSEKEHAMAVVIRRASGDLLCYLVFDEANGLNSFEVRLTHSVGEAIKDVTLGDGQVYLLLKRRRGSPLQEGAPSKGDNTGGLSGNLGGKLHGKLRCDPPFDADYLICALKLASNKKEPPEVIATHKSPSKFKKMVVCPYDGKKIMLLSKRSVFFVATSNEQPSKENVRIVERELLLNSPIVAASWLDFHVFTICLSNNELLFFDLSTDSRHLPRLRCHNSYSRICSIFYHSEHLFVAFATKEIVCFRVNYGALPPAAFRQVTPVEDNYVSTKCLFQRRKASRKGEHPSTGEKPSMEEHPSMEAAKGNGPVNNRRKPPKKCSRTTFESILHEIKNVENKMNDKGFELLEESEGEGRVDDEQAWDTAAFAECIAGGSSMDGCPNSWDDYTSWRSSGEDDPTNEGTPSKRTHRKKDLSQMRKKRKANFAKLHYDEDNLTHIFTPISVVNFEKYITHRISTFSLHRGNLLIQLENGLSYYTTTFNKKKMTPDEDSSFYLCGHTALHKIKDLKVCRGKQLFTLDEARMLKCYSLVDNELNIVYTGRGVTWFEVLSLMGDCNCLFVALTDGSFFFIDLMSCKILLHGGGRRERRERSRRSGGGGRSDGRHGRRCIEGAVFNKVNEHIFNGYFKVSGALLFFFLIHSVSHQKLFIYFLHEVRIGRLLARVCADGSGDQRGDERGGAAPLLLSLSTYRRVDLDSGPQRDYACLLTATGDLRRFYLLFVQLTKKETILMRKKNWDTNVRVFYWKVPHKDVVYGKVIGNYLVLVDFHLNVRFFYMNKVPFGESSLGDSNGVASVLVGKKGSFLRRLKQAKGSRREGVPGPNDEENAFEEFILKRRRRRKAFHPDGVNKDLETQSNEPPNGEDQSSGARLFRLHIGEGDLHINLSHMGRAQFINERMEQDDRHICSFNIVTDSNTVVTFSFDSDAYPLAMVKGPEVQASPMRGTERINFFHPVDMKSGTYDLFLTKGRHLHLGGGHEGGGQEGGNREQGNREQGNREQGNREQGNREGGNCEPGEPLQNNQEGGGHPTPRAAINGEAPLELICQKDVDPTVQATLAKLREGAAYPSDVNFLLRQPSVVFLKVYSSALRKRLRDKRGKSFQERVSIEWGVPSGATKEVRAGGDKVASSGAATSADFPISIAAPAALAAPAGLPHRTNFFFDNETTIFTFLNENEYRLPLEECLANCKNKLYLSALHAKRKEERAQMEKLRSQLRELITQNENSSNSTKLDRKVFFFDKKIINESEILINKYEQIKKKFEKKKLAKEQIIKKLEKKCSPLSQVDFLFGLNTNAYVTNAFKRSNYHHSSPIREKIKFLRFLQIKESEFLQNVEKNNVLCFLKTTKDYIDRYTEDFSCLFLSHYYPYANMNLNYLYANLFGSSFSAGGVDSVQWNYLLYFPCELFTNARKRLQCFVLQMLIEQQKAKFRSHFLALKQEKQNYVEEINLVTNKLKLSLEATDKYFSHPYSHAIDPGLYNRGALKGVKGDALPVSNKFDPDALLKMHLHKLKVESQTGDAFDEREKGDLTVKAQKKGDHLGMGPGLGGEPEADKEPPKDATPRGDEADPESLEIHEKKKNDVRNALSDVKSYIYQISDQCEEFNEKLKQLRKKKYNIQKLIKLHELYCIAIYATLINEERKEEALLQIEKKRTAVERHLSQLEESMRQLDVLQVDEQSLREEKKRLLEKHKRNLALSELLTKKKQKFEKRFLHECINFDVLIEQKYENVIGFDFDSRKNLFIKKKIIQKHIADTNQIIQENFELRRSIRKLKHEIRRNKIKKDYLNFSLMDIEEGVDDVKYLKQNCEFLFSDINNVISSLEAKKQNRKLIFQMSEQKMREQISSVDAKISAIKSENVVLEANMQSLLKEISQMGKAAKGEVGDAANLLDTQGSLGDDDAASARMSFKCPDADVEGEIDQEKEPNCAEEQNRDRADKQTPDQAAPPEKKKKKKLPTRDIHEKSALLRKKYK
ncbi:conserved Plasmodium protein, unknown function [Plasmodium vivax]|uniref:WD repeat-containing protein n=1 Tax=Plasmodium vivax TaxID=5855 RepID=A0A1G4GSQ7_PLAVI|nr:conserved Plasmodium protein, unknown function [Plasmodium vivax]